MSGRARRSNKVFSTESNLESGGWGPVGDWSEVPPGDDTNGISLTGSPTDNPPIFLEAWFRGSEFHHFF